MRKGLLRTSLSIIFIFTILLGGISFSSSTIEPGVIINEDVITLYAGKDSTEDEKYFQFTLTVKGMDASECIWTLSDDTYLIVDNNGLVKLKDDIPNGIDISSVTLTVKNISTNESDTALIFIETDPPLGSVIMSKSLFKDIYVEPTLNPAVVVANTRPAMTMTMFKEQYMEPTLDPAFVPRMAVNVMTKSMFKEQYMEPTLNPVVMPTAKKTPTNSIEFFIQYEEENLSN